MFPRTCTKFKNLEMLRYFLNMYKIEKSWNIERCPICQCQLNLNEDVENGFYPRTHAWSHVILSHLASLHSRTFAILFMTTAHLSSYLKSVTKKNSGFSLFKSLHHPFDLSRLQHPPDDWAYHFSFNQNCLRYVLVWCRHQTSSRKHDTWLEHERIMTNTQVFFAFAIYSSTHQNRGMCCSANYILALTHIRTSFHDDSIISFLKSTTKKNSGSSFFQWLHHPFDLSRLQHPPNDQPYHFSFDQHIKR